MYLNYRGGPQVLKSIEGGIIDGQWKDDAPLRLVKNHFNSLFSNSLAAGHLVLTLGKDGTYSGSGPMSALLDSNVPN